MDQDEGPGLLGEVEVKRALRFFLRTPALWRIGRPLLNLYLLKERNRPFRLWVDFLCRVFEEAYRRDRPVIWTNAFFPVEAIYAVGAVPFLPEIFAALVAYFDWSRGSIAKGNQWLSTDLCSFYRCVMGLAVEGLLPEPDLIITSSHLCDGTNKFFAELGRLYSVPHMLLDPPYGKDRRAKAYVEEQLRDILTEASRLLDLRVRDETLRATVALYRRTWEAMMDVAELRRAVPTPFPGSEGLSYVAGMSFYSMGTEEGLDFFTSLRRYIARRIARHQGYLPRERHRVLWLHHIRPYYPNPIFDFLDRKGIAVTYEEANYPWWPEPDPDDPWGSLAEKVISNPWAGPVEGRIQAVKEMVRAYKVHGVIHFSQWGCRQSTAAAALLGEIVKGMGIPYLILPGDGADPDNYSWGQTITRLQAFSEVLDQRWRCTRG